MKTKIYALHWIFLPQIWKHLNSFRAAWNCHGLRNDRNQSPQQLWTRYREQDPVLEPVEVNVTENYGIDWNGPHSHHRDTVFVPEIQLDRDLTDEEVACSRSDCREIPRHAKIGDSVLLFLRKFFSFKLESGLHRSRDLEVAKMNLLKNPSGEEDMEFWQVTESGGSEWHVEDMPGDCGHEFCNNSAFKYFCTSFELCLKKQVIDLLAEGYTPEDLDSQPAVTVEDWYSGRTDCGCVYQLTVKLLDENMELIDEFNPDTVTLEPEDSSWRQITHTFSEYGPGLRFISFEHGGQDTQYWDGWFGVRVTGSSVTIDL